LGSRGQYAASEEAKREVKAILRRRGYREIVRRRLNAQGQRLP
jgi:hypothetical protein